MKITFIAHSGFLVETEKAYFLFDYYKGNLPVLNPEKPLAVFVSHRHHDHYNRRIWDLPEQYPLTDFVVSFDLPLDVLRKRIEPLRRAEKEGRVLQMEPDSDHTLVLRSCTEEKNKVRIETFRSTDEGVAFFLTSGEESIYHAGDLHLWLWAEEGEAYMEDMKKQFASATERLRGRHADAAFLLLDNRLGDNAFAGMDAYLTMMDISHVFPMHMWEDYALTDAYLEARKNMPQAKALHRISREGQVFEI